MIYSRFRLDCSQCRAFLYYTPSMDFFPSIVYRLVNMNDVHEHGSSPKDVRPSIKEIGDWAKSIEGQVTGTSLRNLAKMKFGISNSTFYYACREQQKSTLKVW